MFENVNVVLADRVNFWRKPALQSRATVPETNPPPPVVVKPNVPNPPACACHVAVVELVAVGT